MTEKYNKEKKRSNDILVLEHVWEATDVIIAVNSRSITSKYTQKEISSLTD